MEYDWKILNYDLEGDWLVRLIAATCDDGIGIMARWTWNRDEKNYGWQCEVWHTEMDSEGRTENDDSDTVPHLPPVLPRIGLYSARIMN